VNAINTIFKAYDIRGKTGTELTPAVIKNIARAFADWLPEQGTVAVGRDMRPDSLELTRAFIAGLRQQGRDVMDLGEITSDMAYFAIGHWDLAGAAVITASHNPGADNGIKLYRDHVIAVGLDSGLDAIRNAVLADQFRPAANAKGSITHRSIVREWVEHCLPFAPDLKPYRIAIDNGNGMAGVVLPSLLAKLPLHAEIMYIEPDGTFPNHEANPQKLENLQDLIKKVRSEKLDFGIAFDGDGDRAVFVDDLGRPVLGTDTMSIIAKLYLEKYPGKKIVHEVRTSRATQELIREWGGQTIRTKAGRVNIGPAMREYGAVFGGETTGHMFFTENYDADSGVITALVAMQALSNSGKKLSQLVDAYRRYIMIPEKNIVFDGDNAALFAQLKQAFADGTYDELDGLTVNFPDGWLNLRVSNTEPVLRLNAEARNETALHQMLDTVDQVIKKES